VGRDHPKMLLPKKKEVKAKVPKKSKSPVPDEEFPDWSIFGDDEQPSSSAAKKYADIVYDGADVADEDPGSPDKKDAPKAVEVLPIKALLRQESAQSMKDLLLQDKKKGLRLTLEQYNYVLLESPTGPFTCKVCYDDSLLLDQIFVLETCGHFICLTCMQTHVVTQIKSAKSYFIRCPEIGCEKSVAHAEAKRCLSAKDFESYQQLLLEDTLKKDPECRWCPRPGCNTAMIGSSQHAMMKCPREECKFAFCFNCKEAWHSDVTCEQYQKWKEENGEADQRYRAWAKLNTKPCPKCKAAIQKNAGCNHMKCINCRYEFCWLCIQGVVDSNGKYKPGHWALDERSPCYNRMHT